MAKDGTARGGARAGSGRKSKALKEKLDSGNPGGRKLTVMELPAESDLSGEDVPEPKSYMLDRQKTAVTLMQKMCSEKPGCGLRSVAVKTW